MISDVDDALRKLILESLTVSQQNVDIMFDLPSRDWASRLSRPTIDIFLFDIRENLRLRGAEQFRSVTRPDGKIEVYRNPVRIDLRYLLSAWTKDPEDEHLLLSDTLMTLLRNPTIPDQYCSENLKNQLFPIILDTAVYQPEHGPTEKVTDVWGVIGNDIHAGFIVTVTITVDPYKPAVIPVVSSFEKKIGIVDQDARPVGVMKISRVEQAFRIVTEKYEPSTLQAVLCERNQNLEVNDNYSFLLPPLEPGQYHVDIKFRGKVLKHQTVDIPADNNEIII